MKNKLITIEESAAYSLAEKYFIRTCGFDLDKAKHQRMLVDGMEAREAGLDGIDIRAKVSGFPGDVYKKNKLRINGVELTCQAFEQIEESNIKKVYVYVLTAGGVTYSDDDPIMKQLYSDIWGTAYTDAGRDLLELELKKDIESSFPGELEKTAFLSDCFGPGFYGMLNTQTKDIFDILDMSDMNVTVRETGIMIPLKSVAGIYFAVENLNGMPHADCMECIINASGCEFCRYRKGKSLGSQ